MGHRASRSALGSARGGAGAGAPGGDAREGEGLNTACGAVGINGQEREAIAREGEQNLKQGGPELGLLSLWCGVNRGVGDNVRERDRRAIDTYLQEARRQSSRLDTCTSEQGMMNPRLNAQLPILLRARGVGRVVRLDASNIALDARLLEAHDAVASGRERGVEADASAADSTGATASLPASAQ